MGAKTYKHPKAGEWVQPVCRGYKMACCDCGLVHKMNFRVVKYADGKRTKVQFQAARDNRATAMIRRHARIRVRVTYRAKERT